MENPDDEPSAWRLNEAKVDPVSGAAGVVLGGAVLEQGKHLLVYGNAGDHHDLYLARFDLERALAGDLTAPEWWTGKGYGALESRTALLTLGAPEYSVHFSKPLDCYVYTQTEGAGASTLAIRTADSPEGPWSEPRDVLRPPESFKDDPFVYAGKAHPELHGADLVATYVPSTDEGGPPDPEEVYYYPRFVRMGYR